MYKYRCITQITTWLKWWGPFLSASKLLFGCVCIYIFLTLLADIQISNWKFVQGLHLMGRVTYSSCPLYSFTLIFHWPKFIFRSQSGFFHLPVKGRNYGRKDCSRVCAVSAQPSRQGECCQACREYSLSWQLWVSMQILLPYSGYTQKALLSY